MSIKKAIFVIGPTAIGKTKISIDLAKILRTDIVSCDSRQFYKELIIGTAPPNKNELQQVKHHFIHNISVTEEYNAGKFEEDAIKRINEIHKKNNTVIVVGGSGLYIDAICKGFDHIPPTSSDLRKFVNKQLEEKGLEWLQNRVKKVDPEFYLTCDKKNPQRLLRVLEIFYETGKSYTSFKTKTHRKRDFNIIKIGLNMNRDQLYDKINTRVDEMLEMGLIDEVSSLLPYKHYNALQTVGYKEIFEFINNEVTIENAINNIKRNTRRFAKRQLTWFKKDPDIKWFKPDEMNEIKAFIGL